MSSNLVMFCLGLFLVGCGLGSPEWGAGSAGAVMMFAATWRHFRGGKHWPY